MKRTVVGSIFLALLVSGCGSAGSETDSPGLGGFDADGGTHSGDDGGAESSSVPEAGHIEASGPGDICGDGLDNDGNGEIDEGCSCEVGKTQPCYEGDPTNVGIGACSFGTQTCQGGANGSTGHWGPCEGSVLPSKDDCDGVDNDCDGSIDEGCPCVDGEEQNCTNICGSGKQTCQGGGWGPCSAPTPKPEECDNIDNDCDGQTDEDLTTSCSTACGSGEKTCSHGQWTDCSAQQPVAEICNDQDDDCDGQTDEGNVCQGCPAQTVYWDGCQGNIDPSAHGQQRQVSNDAVGMAGSAVFSCQKGTWVKSSGSCGTSLCTHDWGTQAASTGDFVKVYIALLNRCPGPAGLYYWNGQGYSDQQVYAFANSPEARTEFQNFTSPDFIVTHIYQTSFNRNPTQAGHDYWVGEFNNGTYHTNDSTLGAFVRAILNPSTEGDQDRQSIGNRAEIGSYFARQLIDHRCPMDEAFSRSILVGVDYSTNLAIPKSKIDQKIKEMENTIKN